MALQMITRMLIVVQTFIGMVLSSSQTDNFISIIGCRTNFVLPKKPFLVITALSTLDCAAVCSRTNGCYSFNACHDGPSVTCSLIAGLVTKGCVELAPQSTCKYRQHVDAAGLMAANPCCNGGSYVGGVCVCVWGFAGVNCCRLIRSCREGYSLGIRGQRLYEIQPFGSSITYIVYCNCDWVGTIYAFKRTIPPPVGCPPINYNRTWEDYKKGFGDINCEYLLGLETMYQLNTFAQYQWNIYNMVSGYSAAASIYLESSVLKSESSNYEIDFVRVFTHPWENGDDAFDISQRPRRFCTWDRDCGGCAKTVGGGWWFTSACAGGSLTAPQSQMAWPVNGVDKVIDQAFIQLDLVTYL